jgi:mannose-6-phosphate isomerase-like protein (cupin superfamily)
MNNINDALAAAVVDEKVGIKVVPMAGDENLSLLVAEVGAGKSLKPHFHKNSIEIYYFEEGTGTMKLGDLKDGGIIAWTDIFAVKKGDCVTVKKGQVHTAENTGDTTMLIIVGCPLTNITTDRYICSE